MIVRSSYPVVDESLCSLQGYGIAAGANLISSSMVINPINGAIFCGGLATAEKLISLFGDSVIPGPEIWVGQIPLGPKNIVRYSIAALVVTQAMELAGLIAAAPIGITVIGGLGVLVLAVCALVKGVFGILTMLKSPEEQVKEIFSSTSKVNRVVSFPHEGKEYRIRCAHDPSATGVSMNSAGISARFIIASEPGTPEALEDKVGALLPKDAKGVFQASGTINGSPAFDYLANV